MVASRLLWLKDARPAQLPPEDDWHIWLILSGRGWGKTRTGAEWIAHNAITKPRTRWAVIAPTYADARDTCVEGVSGLLAILNRYKALANWNRSTGELILTNGSRIKLFSAEEPDRLRGPQFHGAWCDELAAWKNSETYDQMMFGLRLGDKPQIVITTTPKPVALVKMLVKREDGVIITKGSTFDNAANLAETALIELKNRYNNTRLGRQELYGELLEDVEGALWTRAMIEDNRWNQDEKLPPFSRVVVGIDPAVTSSDESDFTGIVTAAMSADGHYYILADDTIKASPQEWATKAVAAYEQHKADRIVAETNNGGDLVIHLLQQVKPNVATRKVTASRGKALRAEPIAALYEQGRVHHVGGFPKLEDEMCEWAQGVSEKSPDRLDALVWALTDLSENSSAINFLSSLAIFCPACRLPQPKSAKVCSSCNTALGDANGSVLNTRTGSLKPSI